MDPVALRIQDLSLIDQVLVLALLAGSRTQGASCTVKAIDQLFHDLSLPAPKRIDNVLRGLEAKALIRRGAHRGLWRVTPAGKARAEKFVSGIDLAVLAGEATVGATQLGEAPHPLILPALAPAGLLPSLQRFLSAHSFDSGSLRG